MNRGIRVGVLVLAIAVLGAPSGADDPPAAGASPTSPELSRADELAAEARALHRRGKTAEAVPLAREVLSLREKALGPEHRAVAQALNDLAILIGAQRKHAEARALNDRALAIRRKLLGEEHVEVAESLEGLSMAIAGEGGYGEAQALLERALAIKEKALGPDHVEVAWTLGYLGSIHERRHAYAESRRIRDRAIAIREKASVAGDPELVSDLASVGSMLFGLGDLAAGQSYIERAVAVLEKASGPESPAVAPTLRLLANVLRDQGAFAEARKLYDRVLRLQRNSAGETSPEYAKTLNEVAALLQGQGAYSEARPLYEQAISIWEGSGSDTASLASALGNLGSLLWMQGDYAAARPLLERALALKTKVYGEESPEAGLATNNLATLLKALGEPEEARRQYERALSIQEKVLGPVHRDVAVTLTGLAILCEERKEYDAAEPLLERVLSIHEKTSGPGHPWVAMALAHLGHLRWLQGRHPEAQTFYERSLAIREAVLGRDHPLVVGDLRSLAKQLVKQGEFEKAAPLVRRALDANERNVRGQLASLEGRQRRALIRSTRATLDDWLHLAPEVGATGYEEVLRMKGLVGRAETAERVLARRASPEDRALVEALRGPERQLARLANRMPDARDTEARAAWQKSYAEAGAERERLSVELTKRTAPLRGALERLDLGLADVRSHLAPDDALVDFLRVGDRYLAWVVRRTGEVRRVDLGAAAAIEDACHTFVASVAADDDADLRGGAEARALVWAPIEGALGDGVRRVVVSPDAALAALPFAALPGSTPGSRLLDRFTIAHATDARDVVPRAGATSRGTGALLVGGVDYDRADGAPPATTPTEAPRALPSLDRAPRGGTFVPIPQTAVEVEALRARFHDAATVLVGRAATEARFLEAVRGRRLVHIATHGFAREDLLAGLYDRRVGDWTSAQVERQLAAGHDPMLLSGLAMAGANPREGGGADDGILTALEASYLDLDGVDLVTLSACDTARGTAEGGEGVQGLVQAFRMAGARSVLASLWPVDDEATRRLMQGFYERFLRAENPLPPADALREAAIALRDSTDASGVRRFAAPRFWAAFVAYGE